MFCLKSNGRNGEFPVLIALLIATQSAIRLPCETSFFFSFFFFCYRDGVGWGWENGVCKASSPLEMLTNMQVFDRWTEIYIFYMCITKYFDSQKQLNKLTLTQYLVSIYNVQCQYIHAHLYIVNFWLKWYKFYINWTCVHIVLSHIIKSGLTIFIYSWCVLKFIFYILHLQLRCNKVNIYILHLHLACNNVHMYILHLQLACNKLYIYILHLQLACYKV